MPRLTPLTAAGLVAVLSAGVLTVSTPARAAEEPSDRQAGPALTRLTFAVDGCEGCQVRLAKARQTLDADVVNVWMSRARTVEDGHVTFRVMRRRTHGMVVTVKAPWEGNTGYATTVAWRYNGEAVGDPVTLEEAVTKRRASACWAGTRARRLSVPLVVEEVEVRGVQGRVPGSIAFAPTTSDWLPPMRRTVEGVLGLQDVDICG